MDLRYIHYIYNGYNEDPLYHNGSSLSIIVNG